LVAAFAGLVLVCSCATTTEFDRFTAENPPCAGPELTEAQVLSVAKDALGRDFDAGPSDVEPNRRVTPYKCTYLYEQSLLTFNGKPGSLDGFDCCIEIYVSRTCEVFGSNWSVSQPSASSCPTMH
jgi:hypothetical protein